MAPRAMWKGAISFGLVTIPIGLSSAIEARERLAFHLLHEKDGSRVVQKRFCKDEDVEIPWKDVVRGYEHAKGEYVVLTDADFEKARVPATQLFEIRAFVKAADVPDLYFDHPYYASPQGRSAVKGYALLRDVLAETAKLGIGTIVLREREHLAALAPYGDALVLTTMRFAHEIRSPKDLSVPARHTGYSDKEMKLAVQLTDTLSDAWKPRDYRDTYTDVLRSIIEAKAEGTALPRAEAPKRPRVIDLADALRRSLARKDRPLAKAASRSRGGSRRSARASRRAAA